MQQRGRFEQFPLVITKLVEPSQSIEKLERKPRNLPRMLAIDFDDAIECSTGFQAPIPAADEQVIEMVVVEIEGNPSLKVEISSKFWHTNRAEDRPTLKRNAGNI
jgi:hypothetical protein